MQFVIDFCLLHPEEEVIRIIQESNLLDNPDAINSRDPVSGRTILHMVCKNRRPQVLKYLLTSKAIDVNLPLFSGKWYDFHQPPLVLATFNYSFECFLLLLEDPRTDVNLEVNGHNIITLMGRFSKGLELKHILASMHAVNIGDVNRLLVKLFSDDRVGPLFEVLKNFNMDPKKNRMELRKELKLVHYDVVTLFVLVVMCTDGYFVPKYPIQQYNWYWVKEKVPEKSHFFILTRKLPMELQSRICNLAFGQKDVHIKASLFERALKTFVKDHWF